MVNRKDDGTTIYNFVCYGLMESQGRHNAFFGCSIEMTGRKYVADFKLMFDWFDYMFGRLVDRGKVFTPTSEGVLRYNIDKFSNAAEEIEWFKSNLPNIFNSDSVTIQTYDNSFSTKNLGKVLCLNIDTPEQKVLADFKKSHWVAVSPVFMPEEPVEEINFADLLWQYIKYNENALKVAVNPSAQSLPWIQNTLSECQEISESLSKYRKHINDDEQEELQQYNDIVDKYRSLSETLAALKTRIAKPEAPEPPKPDGDKRCSKCNRRLPLSHFDSPHSNLCMECAKSKKMRVCKKCGQMKPSSSYAKNPEICEDCLSTPQPKPISFLDRINPIYGAATVLGIFILVGLFLVLKPKPSNEEQVTPEPAPIENSFSFSHFSDLKDAGSYDEAFAYADKYPEGDRYKKDLKYAIERELSSLSQTNPIEYQVFLNKYQDLIKSLGINTSPFDELSRLSDPIIVEVNPYLHQEEQPEVRSSANEEVKKAMQKAPVAVTIVNEDKDNKAIGNAITTKASRSYSFEEGTYVNVTSKSDVKLKTNTSCSPIDGGIRIELKSGMVYRFEIDNITITINVKAKAKAQNNEPQTV